MFSYVREQKIGNIGGIKVGGQPGENAPLLIGSMFQKGDQLIENRQRGKAAGNIREGRLRQRWAVVVVPHLVVLGTAEGVQDQIALLLRQPGLHHVLE